LLKLAALGYIFVAEGYHLRSEPRKLQNSVK